mmetsp:Transcript_7104/g.26597  ORF Transcript_7104/g.26597 Transcript_7104/m.26597 type:complete len:117 (-) Transcript_7104:2169-2519(-)
MVGKIARLSESHIVLFLQVMCAFCHVLWSEIQKNSTIFSDVSIGSFSSNNREPRTLCHGFILHAEMVFLASFSFPNMNCFSSTLHEVKKIHLAKSNLLPPPLVTSSSMVPHILCFK